MFSFAQHTYVSYVSSLRSDVVMALNFFTGTFVYLLSHGESIRQKKYLTAAFQCRADSSLVQKNLP